MLIRTKYLLEYHKKCSEETSTEQNISDLEKLIYQKIVYKNSIFLSSSNIIKDSKFFH